MPSPGARIAKEKPGVQVGEGGCAPYTRFVPSHRGKFVALLLLLLMALDLSTATVCEAKSFPGESKVAVNGGLPVATAQAQSVDDDGCFCCCAHIVVAGPGMLMGPELLASTHAGLVIPESPRFPQSLFHPPKA